MSNGGVQSAGSVNPSLRCPLLPVNLLNVDVGVHDQCHLKRAVPRMCSNGAPTAGVPQGYTSHPTFTIVYP